MWYSSFQICFKVNWDKIPSKLQHFAAIHEQQIMTKQQRYEEGGCLDILHLAATWRPQIDGIVHISPKYRNDHSEQATAQAADPYNILQFLIWFSDILSHMTSLVRHRGHINFMKFGRSFLPNHKEP